MFAHSCGHMLHLSCACLYTCGRCTLQVPFLTNAAKLQWAVHEVSLDLQWLEFVQWKSWKKWPGPMLSSANSHCHCHCSLRTPLHNKKSLKLHRVHKLYNSRGTQCTARHCPWNPYGTQWHKPCSHPLHWIRSPWHKYTRQWKPRSSNLRLSDNSIGIPRMGHDMSWYSSISYIRNPL